MRSMSANTPPFESPQMARATERAITALAATAQMRVIQIGEAKYMLALRQTPTAAMFQ